MDKKQARRAGLEARSALSFEICKTLDKQILQKLIPYIQQADIIGCYISFHDEADTYALMRYAYEQGKQIAVPTTHNHTLVFHLIDASTRFQKGYGGILEPCGSALIDISQVDLMLVPLSAFDHMCHRTGYGKGFYDTILSQCKYTVGIAYHVQEVEYIDVDPWDVTLDEIVTDQKSIKK